MEEEEECEGGAGWQATFSDLMSLLLTFFVLLLSFANMDAQQFKMALGSVKDALGVKTDDPGYHMARASSPIEWEGKSEGAGKREKKSISSIKAMIKKKKLGNRVTIDVTDRHISMKLYRLFESSEATIDPKSFELLDLAVEMCRMFSHPIAVEAHTDDRPIHSERFPSNWELSAMRAGVISRYLVEGGHIDPKRVTAAGMAATRPAASNSTADGRAKNRRVEIVLSRRREKPVQITEPSRWR